MLCALYVRISTNGNGHVGAGPDLCPICSRAAAIEPWQVKERTGSEEFHPLPGRPGPFEKETVHEPCRLKLSVL